MYCIYSHPKWLSYAEVGAASIGSKVNSLRSLPSMQKEGREGGMSSWRQFEFSGWLGEYANAQVKEVLKTNQFFGSRDE